MAAPASRMRERRANFSIIIVIVPCFVDLSSRLRIAVFFSGPTMALCPLTVVVFVQLVNTISGGILAGNEHLHDSVLDQNGLGRVDARAG
ncbi:hypothetical protein [Mesorhizobium sangaii]|uniref:Uncharacterized protein n=1 Tax=Mesorhizobium sangaii TaxID=505389 RepID=A0A841PHY0_9HYPH|nr:hypothetical protein [Mesorhizobium sangaii]MBB6413561.1 hypothetical protein [Mesorhizobium sangaii]